MRTDLQQVFKAVADTTRREIFQVLVLSASPLSISEISGHFDISRQGVTKHLKLLQEAGLVQIVTSGRERFCQANAQPLSVVRDWVSLYERYWDDKLARLESHLNRRPGDQDPVAD